MEAKEEIELKSTFSIPIWSVKKARKFFDNCLDDDYINSVAKIKYKEENIILFTNFIVTLTGTIIGTKFILQNIDRELKALKIL